MNKQTYLLLEITANGCATCVTMGAMIHELAMQYPNMEARSQDVQSFDQESLQKLGVKQTPVLLLIKDEEVLGAVYGYQPREILSLWIESKISPLS